jgi:DNA-binding XRE family transcriptional regulator
MCCVTSGKASVNVGSSGSGRGGVSDRVGENIRRLAGMFLVEQRRLAAEADITRQSLYAIYSGKSRPSAETALRIAAAFGITVNDLYASPAECLGAALPHLEDAPITVDHDLPPGTVTDVVTGEVTPLKKRRA